MLFYHFRHSLISTSLSNHKVQRTIWTSELRCSQDFLRGHWFSSSSKSGINEGATFLSSKTFLKKNIFQKFCSFFGSEKTSKQRLGLAAAAEYERERERERVCVCACVCGREREKESYLILASLVQKGQKIPGTCFFLTMFVVSSLAFSSKLSLIIISPSYLFIFSVIKLYRQVFFALFVHSHTVFVSLSLSPSLSLSLTHSHALTHTLSLSVRCFNNFIGLSEL